MRKITIEKKEDLYKKIFLYKSILYKNTTFSIESTDESIQSIVKALNIKNRKKRIEYIYDYCCQKIDEYYKDKNICGFSNNQCIKQRQLKCKRKNGCCNLCPHQTSRGCPTANLACKLLYCGEIKNKRRILKSKDLKILKLFSIRQKIIVKSGFYATREQHIMDLYLGSIILFCFRTTIREIFAISKLIRR